ncbi:hypothetical protein [Shewanella aestuarii]|uniref:Uncharacterized protein n=1 Tax=Shewanella aestuarii TaxID=1028752 RepID=A0A6G9QQC1_9GAMM|nr:hypothetical protein [Shewanella aestuarii]QIR16618.1 hypothetical protein HBH39_19270 [Shewanella aestuarii]
MNKLEFNMNLRSCGLSNSEFAEVIGVESEQVEAWSMGVPIPDYVEGELIELNATIDEVKEIWFYSIMSICATTLLQKEDIAAIPSIILTAYDTNDDYEELTDDKFREDIPHVHMHTACLARLNSEIMSLNEPDYTEMILSELETYAQSADKHERNKLKMLHSQIKEDYENEQFLTLPMISFAAVNKAAYYNWLSDTGNQNTTQNRAKFAMLCGTLMTGSESLTIVPNTEDGKPYISVEVCSETQGMFTIFSIPEEYVMQDALTALRKYLNITIPIKSTIDGSRSWGIEDDLKNHLENRQLEDYADILLKFIYLHSLDGRTNLFGDVADETSSNKVH